ncbi:hypothetical protein WICPIJ_008054 [Wickerhamomyces pijperi]|uniref:Uncharacterized protein n=1 Tax=Wickerhamomyces pijperi TaxID=599730 RepID=A0A9P8Q1A2_WICPI|nr:hypothetical protein WICPIJ_008054 [Wickerhamomyces pijperi]
MLLSLLWAAEGLWNAPEETCESRGDPLIGCDLVDLCLWEELLVTSLLFWNCIGVTGICVCISKRWFLCTCYTVKQINILITVLYLLKSSSSHIKKSTTSSTQLSNWSSTSRSRCRLPHHTSTSITLSKHIALWLTSNRGTTTTKTESKTLTLTLWLRWSWTPNAFGCGVDVWPKLKVEAEGGVPAVGLLPNWKPPLVGFVAGKAGLAKLKDLSEFGVDAVGILVTPKLKGDLVVEGAAAPNRDAGLISGLEANDGRFVAEEDWLKAGFAVLVAVVAPKPKDGGADVSLVAPSNFGRAVAPKENPAFKENAEAVLVASVFSVEAPNEDPVVAAGSLFFSPNFGNELDPNANVGLEEESSFFSVDKVGIAVEPKENAGFVVDSSFFSELEVAPNEKDGFATSSFFSVVKDGKEAAPKEKAGFGASSFFSLVDSDGIEAEPKEKEGFAAAAVVSSFFSEFKAGNLAEPNEKAGLSLDSVLKEGNAVDPNEKAGLSAAEVAIALEDSSLSDVNFGKDAAPPKEKAAGLAESSFFSVVEEPAKENDGFEVDSSFLSEAVELPNAKVGLVPSSFFSAVVEPKEKEGLEADSEAAPKLNEGLAASLEASDVNAGNFASSFFSSVAVLDGRPKDSDGFGSDSDLEAPPNENNEDGLTVVSVDEAAEGAPKENAGFVTDSISFFSAGRENNEGEGLEADASSLLSLEEEPKEKAGLEGSGLSELVAVADEEPKEKAAFLLPSSISVILAEEDGPANENEGLDSDFGSAVSAAPSLNPNDGFGSAVSTSLAGVEDICESSILSLLKKLKPELGSTAIVFLEPFNKLSTAELSVLWNFNFNSWISLVS